MAAIMAVFGTSAKKKGSDFEEWLSENGFFYIKTKDNRPCFKSKLTQYLEKQFKMEKTNMSALEYLEQFRYIQY